MLSQGFSSMFVVVNGKTKYWTNAMVIKEAYVTKIRPLSNSDNNTIQLILIYRSSFRKSKPVLRTVNVWCDSIKEELSGCFLATNWEVFLSR